ncbi:MAG: hypothetical protein KC416_01185 [Myxococcales bacterium]|nr:hypothetical protein [Myxococcales bacterium]
MQPRLLTLSLGLMALLWLPSCDGETGDVCQVEDDCGSGLMCCKLSSALEERGTCQATCEPIATDGGGMDGSTDGGKAQDASPSSDGSTDGG